MFPISSLYPLVGAEGVNSLDNLFASENGKLPTKTRTTCNVPLGSALKRLQLKQATEYKRNFANFLTQTSNTGFNVNKKDMIRLAVPVSRQKKTTVQPVFAPNIEGSFSEMRIPTAGSINIEHQ